jgi:hypothetical protein
VTQGAYDSKKYEPNSKQSDKKSTIFPKNVGIIFMESMERYPKGRVRWISRWIPSKEPSLDFDQLACSHLLLQMNSIQSLFDFRVVHVDVTQSLSKFREVHKNDRQKLEDDVTEWFKDVLESKFQDKKNKENTISLWNDIDIWIGITSERLPNNVFARILPKSESNLDRNLAVITSNRWKEVHAPPSVFEYICINSFICCLDLLSCEFTGGYVEHEEETKGCLFDYTEWKHDRRILVSNPILCIHCKNRLRNLAAIISGNSGTAFPLVADVEKVLLREKWMGTLEKRDSPLYNLKKMYGYDVDANSGFYKKWWEVARDNIKENSAIWIVGAMLTLLVTFLTGILNLKS